MRILSKVKNFTSNIKKRDVAIAITFFVLGVLIASQ
tara:strand:+ start:485 stop:592 length:108 start_codon:yes stop_codon:yes gene_type:complete